MPGRRRRGLLPGALLAAAGAAVFTERVSLHRWCPDDPAPVEIATDEPIGDLAADDDAVYYIGAGGLIRIDRVSGSVWSSVSRCRSRLSSPMTAIAWSGGTCPGCPAMRPGSGGKGPAPASGKWLTKLPMARSTSRLRSPKERKSL